MYKVNMQTCLDLINECSINPYDAKVDFGSVYFFLSDEDFAHIFEYQNLIRDLITPKYQIMFHDFGYKAVVITLSRNLL